MTIYQIFHLLYISLLTTGLVFSYNTAISNDKTNFIITGGFAVNGNIYLSDFKQLPGIENCCKTYKDAFGLGESIFGGIEYIYKKNNIFGNVRLSLRASYSNLSAVFREEKFFAHHISGNEYTNAYSEHTIDASLGFLMIVPGVISYPIGDFPLGISAGFQLGVPLQKQFSQQEKFIKPEGLYFENGTQYRYKASGTIPDAASIYFALSAGARYEIYKKGNFTFAPEIKFNLGFTNIVKSLNWTASSIMAGIAVQYRIPNAEPKPPLAPPTPPLPPTPALKKLELAMDIFVNGKQLNPGDTIVIPSNETLYINKYTVVPIIFFAPNSTDMITSTMENQTGEENAQMNCLTSVISYLNSNSQVKVKIISSSVDDESTDIIDKRIEYIAAKLLSEGISSSRISEEKTTYQRKEFNYQELADEARYIKFEFSDNRNLISIISDTVKETEYISTNLKIKPVYTSDAGDVKIKGEIIFAGKKIFDFNNNEVVYSIFQNHFFSSSQNIQKSMVINAEAIDSEGLRQETSFNLNLKAESNIIDIHENITSLNDSGSQKVSQYVLGYCKFDKSEFYAVNSETVALVKKAMEDGFKIELIPLYDNLGTTEHNRRLASDRASTAMKILEIAKNQVKIIYPEVSVFSNSTPYGRTLNRTVLVRIIRK